MLVVGKLSAARRGLRRYGFEVMGREETYPKIAAARALGLPVVMIGRPHLPASDVVDGPTAALTWLLTRGGGRVL